jgi:PhzF family phenazine biosynthesis protein
MRYFIVDAFTDKLFAGNQAGVCLLDEWPLSSVMQSIAAENNLSETAFVVKQDGHYGLRWFTPEIEVDLCGHATLASAFVISNFVDSNTLSHRFETLSGTLNVSKNGDLYEMDFPSRKPVPTELTDLMRSAIDVPVLEAHLSNDLLLIVENERQVRELKPDYSLLKQLPDGLGVIVSSEGESVDFVSRFFAPKVGVSEDPVTGRSHTVLTPFWSERLGKSKMTAKQLSKRGGTIYCENCGNRVKIAGNATLYLQGEIRVD